MIQADLYYGVQFTQSLYLLLTECGRLREIPDRVFSSSDEISVRYGEEFVKGREQVCRFFGKWEADVFQNGFLRIDVPATQYIEVLPDGRHALGHYLTMTKLLTKSGGDSQYQTLAGRYTNLFVLEEGIWKLQDVRWEKLCEFERSKETPDPNLERYRKNPHAWLPELPTLQPLSKEGISKKTAEIISLRNEIFSWFYRIDTEGFASAAIPISSQKARLALADMLKNSRYLFVTSPVIQMNDKMDRAEAFLSTSILYEVSPGSFVDSRGSICLNLENVQNSWQITSFEWYPYASLEPWRIA